MAEIHTRDHSEDHAENLLAAVNESARLARRVFNTFLVAAALAALMVWMTDDKQILLGGAITAFQTTIALPIGGFTIAIQWLILLLHFNLLLHLAFLAEKLNALETAIAALPGSAAHELYRVRVFPFFFCHRLIGTRHMRALAALISWVFLALCPLLLLLAVQITLLPYHDAAITWWHRVAVMADIVFLAAFWPRIVAPASDAYAWWAGPYHPCANAARDLLSLVSGVAATAGGIARRRISLQNSLTAPWQHLYANRLPVPYREAPATPHVAEPAAVALTGLAVLVLVLLVAVIPGEAIERWAVRAAPSFLLTGKDGLEQGCRPETLAATCRLFDRRTAVFHRNLQLANTVLVSADTAPQTVFDLRKDRSGRQDARRAAVGLILVNRDLRYADFRRAIMPKADLRGANLDFADLSGADLWNGNLGGHTIAIGKTCAGRHKVADKIISCPARLMRARLTDTELSGARMVGALLEGAVLTRARLDGADLTRALLRGADLDEARLRGARLRGAILESAYLREAQLQGANLRRARLRGANLTGAGLEGANLTGARLGGTLLDNAQFTGAVLRDARLEGAHMLGARFQGADLSRARMRGADMRRTQLQGASLERARLDGADLRGASVAGAKFNFARLDLADLRRLRERKLGAGQFKRLSAVVEKAIAPGPARAKVLKRLERARREAPSFVAAKMTKPGLCDNARYFKNCVFKNIAEFIPNHTSALRKLACTSPSIAVSMVRRVVSAGAPNLLQWHLARSLVETPVCKAIAALPEIIHVKLKETGAGKKPRR
jgi:uncharacterized protein YjbI with pentapeptide repeats